MYSANSWRSPCSSVLWAADIQPKAMRQRTPSPTILAVDRRRRAFVLGTPSSRPRGRNLLRLGLVSLALLLVAPASGAFAQVRIGLTGDSIVEGAGVTSPQGLRAA